MSVANIRWKPGKAHIECDIDLEPALQKFHDLCSTDAAPGYGYWYHIGHLLQRAAGMQADIDALSKQLEMRLVEEHVASREELLSILVRVKQLLDAKTAINSHG